MLPAPSPLVISNFFVTYQPINNSTKQLPNYLFFISYFSLFIPHLFTFDDSRFTFITPSLNSSSRNKRDFVLLTPSVTTQPGSPAPLLMIDTVPLTMLLRRSTPPAI